MCSHCILDTNDDAHITFDQNGVCNYCLTYQKSDHLKSVTKSDNYQTKLNSLIEEIKNAGKNNKYDCLIGVSGGVDSTYVAYQAKQLGLRPLIFHYDNGWNSELAVKNIENTVTVLNFDLYTYVNNWEEFKDLQLAFMKASVVDIELLTDHAIGALQLILAAKFNIKYIISGTNMATEAILPSHWYHWKIDALNIKAIHKQFGKIKLKTYPLLGYFKRMYYTRILKIKIIPLLDYIPFNKDEAKRTIIEALGWRDYGGKHYESIFTRFYQAYILPNKFKIDKRKAHLSTLICSGQMTREQALTEIKQAIFPPDKLKEDKEYVLKKFNLTEREFDDIMSLPVKQHTDYPSYFNRHYKYEAVVFKTLRPITRFIKKLQNK